MTSSPDLAVFSIADHALVSRDNKLSVIGIFSEINVEKLPVVIPMHYVVMKWDSGFGDFKAELKIKDPKGTTIVERDAEFTMKAESSTHIYIHGLSNFNFEFEGKYLVEAYLNGELIKTKSLTVRKIVKQ